MKKISERLLEERERLKLNKGQMAAAGGVANSTYTNYEEGRRSPDGDFLASIATAGADVQYILTGVKSISLPVETITLTAEQARLLNQVLSMREVNLLDYFRNISDEEDKKAVERTAYMAARPATKDSGQSEKIKTN